MTASTPIQFHFVRLLILKDWYLQRGIIFASLGAGAVSLGIIAFGGKAGFILGAILLVTVVIAVGAQISLTSTVIERKEQNLAFIMSLPITSKDYTAAKVLGALLIFLVPWLVMVGVSLALFALVPALPQGLIPFFIIMSLEIVISTCLLLSVALLTESQGWAIGTLLFGNLFLNAFGYYVAHLDGIASHMWADTADWNHVVFILICSEVVAVLVLLGATFYFQSRKTDFA